MPISKKRLVWFVFLFIFIAEYALGHYITYINGFIMGDAISRVANAFYVIFSRDPHLGAIGFVWNPLPSLVELLFVGLWPIFPMFVSKGMAAVITTAMFAAGSASLLLAGFMRAGVANYVSLPIVLLYAFNPFVFMYGSNGMTELMFTFFIIAVIVYYTGWMEDMKTKEVVIVGMSLGLAFLVRYEAVPFGVCLAICVVIHIWHRRYYERTELKELRVRKYRTIEATLVIMLAPAVFAGVSWIWYNYSIMGDAFYFFRSNYSNLGQSEALANNEVFGALIHNPVKVIQYMFSKSIYFSLPLFVILFFRALTNRWRRVDVLMLLLLSVSILVLQFIMLLTGASYGWLRFFFYVLPIAIAWLPYEFNNESGQKYRRSFAFSILASLLLSSVMVWSVMNDSELASEEYTAIRFKESPTYEELRVSRDIASYLDELIEDSPESLILMDSFNAFNVILNSQYHKQLMITSDYDFYPAIDNLFDYDVTHVLVPQKEGVSALNAVNVAFPELYENGANWARLIEEFDDQWRLYEIAYE